MQGFTDGRFQKIADQAINDESSACSAVVFFISLGAPYLHPKKLSGEGIRG
jgi:hypothetical protein